MDKASDHASKVAQTDLAVPATVATPPAKATTSATVIQIEQPKASASDANGMLPAWLALVGVIITLTIKWVAEGIQRRYELRRELYLDLIDGIGAANLCIGRLCDANVSFASTVEQFQSAGPKIAKVELIAPKKLSKALTAYRDAHGKAFMNLLTMRAEIERLKTDTDLIEPDIAKYDREKEYVVEEIKRAKRGLFGTRTCAGRSRTNYTSGKGAPPLRYKRRLKAWRK
jgi:hypothetical protein